MICTPTKALAFGGVAAPSVPIGYATLARALSRTQTHTRAHTSTLALAPARRVTHAKRRSKLDDGCCGTELKRASRGVRQLIAHVG